MYRPYLRTRRRAASKRGALCAQKDCIMRSLIRYGATERVFTEAAEYPELHPARVTSQYKGLYKITTGTDECLADVSGKFRHEETALSRFPAVGDFVLASLAEAGAGNAVIHRVLRRTSVIGRAAVGLEAQTQIIAANIDVIFICMALNNDYNTSRLERYLAVAWDSGATPVVILTKSDLCPDVSAILDELATVAPGVAVITTSMLDGTARDRILPYLGSGVTASFIGSSGVGKSTLVNLIAGEERFATADIRKGDDKGKHTTTRRELMLLPQGGIVIDTPGMRELGVSSADFSRSFGDVEALVEQCRFHDCSHGTEPGCAVREALETGLLDARRWANYQKLRREAEYNSLSSRQLEARKLNGMFEHVGGMKKARQHLRRTDKRR